MSKERLQEYAQLAEILGAVAIVVSLLFVGVQVRQSNSIATSDAILVSTQLWIGAYREVYGSSESIAFFRKAINHCEDLSDDERGRFFAMLGSFIAAYDNVYSQYMSGRLPVETFVSIGTTYYGIANTPCAHEVLTREYHLMPPWLVSASGIEELSEHADQMRLHPFLRE